MNSETFYPRWDLLKNTLLHISNYSEERTLVVTLTITFFANLCCFVNFLAQNLLLRKLHSRILFKNCTFQYFSDFDCEFTEFFVLSCLFNYYLSHSPESLTHSLSLFM